MNMGPDVRSGAFIGALGVPLLFGSAGPGCPRSLNLLDMVDVGMLRGDPELLCSGFGPSSKGGSQEAKLLLAE